MGVEIPVGYGQASLVFTVQGKTDDIVTTIGYDVAADFAGPNVAQSIRDCWTGSGKPFSGAQMILGYTFQGVRATTMTANGPVLTEFISPVVGTNNMTPLPPNCAFLIRKNTARGGRKGRGRSYFPPSSAGETFVDAAGNIDAASVTMVTGHCNAALAAMNTALLPAVLLHSDPLDSPEPIISMSCQGKIATQRRRLR